MLLPWPGHITTDLPCFQRSRCGRNGSWFVWRLAAWAFFRFLRWGESYCFPAHDPSVLLGSFFACALRLELPPRFWCLAGSACLPVKRARAAQPNNRDAFRARLAPPFHFFFPGGLSGIWPSGSHDQLARAAARSATISYRPFSSGDGCGANILLLGAGRFSRSQMFGAPPPRPFETNPLGNIHFWLPFYGSLLASSCPCTGLGLMAHTILSLLLRHRRAGHPPASLVQSHLHHITVAISSHTVFAHGCSSSIFCGACSALNGLECNPWP